MPTFEDNCGRNIQIEFDESSLTCIASHDGKAIGEFVFDDCPGYEDGQSLLLTNAHLEKMPGFTHCGIGRAMLKIVTKSGYHVSARRNDGIPRDDGSHLTKDAPAFIESMVKDGLISYLDDDEQLSESDL